MNRRFLLGVSERTNRLVAPIATIILMVWFMLFDGVIIKSTEYLDAFYCIDKEIKIPQ